MLNGWQIHGYRQGHRLLEATAELSRADQEVVNRVSDISGPLRPGERFKPYLTCYPLPSGRHYVVARTWQDLAAQRAGCVVTVSVFIRTATWAESARILEFLDEIDGIAGACRPDLLTHPRPWQDGLPPFTEPAGSEIVEALFLEKRRPTVAFGISQSELLAVRVLTALWPSFRRKFSLCDFAMSSRKAADRPFDLQLAPMDARSRYADFQGRRIEGGATSERHAWTNDLANRVLRNPHPRLLDLDGAGILATDPAGEESALRVSLLWADLERRLQTSPTAALGLLDIASTRSERGSESISLLEPALVRAAQQAVATLEPKEAWTFLVALNGKLRGRATGAKVKQSVLRAAEALSAREPALAASLVADPSSVGGADALVRAVASGLANLEPARLSFLVNAEPSVVARLFVDDLVLAVKAIGANPAVISRLAEGLETAEPALLAQARDRLAPILLDLDAIRAAVPLIQTMDGLELQREVSNLVREHQLAVPEFDGPVVERARALSLVTDLREWVVALGESAGAERLLRATLEPTSADFGWLTRDTASAGLRRRLARRVLSAACPADLRRIASSPLAEDVSQLLLEDVQGSFAELRLLASQQELDVDLLAIIVQDIIPYARGEAVADIAASALERILPKPTTDQGGSLIELLLRKADGHYDASSVMRAGVARSLDGVTAARNVRAFGATRGRVRERMVAAVPALCSAIVERRRFDLGVEAAQSAAGLIWSAVSKEDGRTLSEAAGLLAFLLRQRSAPVSSLIAAIFPPVYLQLKRGNNVPDIWRLFSFGYWDHCRTARHELVDAFLSSSWAPGDLALAAVRVDDCERILRRVRKFSGGEDYLLRVERDLTSLPDPVRRAARSALSAIRSSDSP
jgi:hypothetical protein